MTLKLYGFPLSACTRFVALICKEKEVPYELVPIDITKGEHKAASYVEFQPFGQVPYINDDGFILYESRAIARYLVKKYPNQGTQGLIPSGLKEEALFEQAASIEAFNFDTIVSPLSYEKLIKPRVGGGEPDEERIKEFLGRLGLKLDVYDGILKKQKYLAGDSLTLADLQHLPYGSLLFYLGYGDVITSRPNVARWFAEISSRPSWEAVKGGA